VQGWDREKPELQIDIVVKRINLEGGRGIKIWHMEI